MVRIRRAFDEQLHALNARLVEMGAFVEAMVDNSIQALKKQDVALAQEGIAADDTVDDMDLQIEQSCMTLLALQQPMARDLRTIGTIMKVIADVERIGDYAVDIARTAITLADSEFFKPLVDIPRMSELVAAMLRKVIQALVKRDLDLVAEVIAEDDEVDKMWYSLLDELTVMMQERSEIVPQAVALLLVARYLERIADHTVNVAERVAYMETGQLCDLAPSHRTKTESDS